jgi:hypothetical protein
MQQLRRATMKLITKYQADDGSEWSTAEQAQDRDLLCERVSAVMSAWPAHPENDGCEFLNGGGYIQLSEHLFDQVKDQLLDIIKERVDHKEVEQIRSKKAPLNLVAMLISDCGMGPVNAAWRRLSCVDSYFREWGQPYFASNPDRGQQRQIA